jgi:hypothetical protein
VADCGPRGDGEEVDPVVPSADVQLALAAAMSRILSWSGADPADDAAAVRAGRQLERSAHLAVVAAVKRLRGAGRTWRELAPVLGLDSRALGVQIADEALLAFTYCAGLAQAPAFARPSLVWGCRSCGQTVVDNGPGVQGDAAETGHADGCPRIGVVNTGG